MVAMLMDDQEAFQTAKQFFEHDYHDRGMVKWQGFYLSDHTEDVENYTDQEAAKRKQALMPEMDEVKMSAVLYRAYTSGTPIRYQLCGKTDLGIYSPVLTGKVNGYLNDEIYINQTHVFLENLNWCELIQ